MRWESRFAKRTNRRSDHCHFASPSITPNEPNLTAKRTQTAAQQTDLMRTNPYSDTIVRITWTGGSRTGIIPKGGPGRLPSIDETSAWVAGLVGGDESISHRAWHERDGELSTFALIISVLPAAGWEGLVRTRICSERRAGWFPRTRNPRADLNGGLHHRAKARRVVQLISSCRCWASQCDTFDYKP